MAETVHCSACNADHEVETIGALRAIECPMVPPGQAYTVNTSYSYWLVDGRQVITGVAGLLHLVPPGELARLRARGGIVGSAS